MKHRSGSLTEWKKRREAYEAKAGPMSNPDPKRKAERRRLNAAKRMAAKGVK